MCVLLEISGIEVLAHLQEKTILKDMNKREDQDGIVPFASKIWLSSPTMHGDEIKYIIEAYESNWMSTVGKNINEVEHLACRRSVADMRLPCPQGQPLCTWQFD